MDDPYDLRRFVDAQNPLYAGVLDELAAGRKRSHWMWFVFPQLRGLGASTMAHRYAISSLAEAQAYLRHAVLGPRLRECTLRVNQVEGRSIEDIFGFPDYLKFRSSMTLFARAAKESVTDADLNRQAPYEAALRKYFNGESDPATLRLL